MYSCNNELIEAGNAHLNLEKKTLQKKGISCNWNIQAEKGIADPLDIS